MHRVLIVAPLLAFGACAPGAGEPEVDDDPRIPVPSVGGAAQVVPGPGLPAEVVVQPAANNLDLADHDGRLFLAFRTAPDHFASEDAHLYLLSTVDEHVWRYEGEIHLGTDLREPRLLSFQGELFLFFAVLGSDPLAFEPGEARVARWLGEGVLTEPEPFYEPGFIPWRARVVGGVAYLIGYVGGENIYDGDGEPIEVHWLASDDGFDWGPAVPGQPVVQTGGGSETDFAFLDDGSVVAVTRNEAGDETGWGSKVCRAEAGTLGSWTCVHDPKKYDSPLVFRHGGGVWLIARRNLSEDGTYDLGRDDLSPQQQTLLYETDYWIRPKRCSLWRVDPGALDVEYVLDLPSKGDTCFASEVPRGDADRVVYNYSSPLEGEDVDWVTGQHGETRIYRQVLTFR